MEPCHASVALESTLGRAASIKTTLYELIEATSDVIEAGEERLIPKILLHLIYSGKIEISASLDYL
jgi:hypothetical protein